MLKNEIEKNNQLNKKIIKKIKIKIIRIKIEIQKVFYLWLNGEIKKKNNFTKEQKNCLKNKKK